MDPTRKCKMQHGMEMSVEWCESVSVDEPLCNGCQWLENKRKHARDAAKHPAV